MEGGADTSLEIATEVQSRCCFFSSRKGDKNSTLGKNTRIQNDEKNTSWKAPSCLDNVVLVSLYSLVPFFFFTIPSRVSTSKRGN